MRHLRFFLIVAALIASSNSQAAPQNERVAFCEDQSQSKFPSRYEMQKAYNKCMENADQLIQSYEQDKLRRAEQDRIAYEKREKERRLKSLQDNRDKKTDGNVADVSGPSESYSGRIRARIKPNISYVGEIQGNPSTEVEVHCAPDGTILKVGVTKSSGNVDWDNSVMAAIKKTEILPRDVDGRVHSPLVILFRPRE